MAVTLLMQGMESWVMNKAERRENFYDMLLGITAKAKYAMTTFDRN
jgi:hypothetical protein